jgi:ABC-2 type transport system permease protein
MAVYKRGYEQYEGPLTPQWSRFLIIARFAYRRVFDSRFLIGFFLVCCIYPAVCAALIYLPHNSAVATLLGRHNLIPIDAAFFLKFLSWQGGMAFLLTGFLGPGLVSPDLTNNALPLYFCRPFSRVEYVIGKMAVLAILISAITWVPGWLLFGFQAYLGGWAWFWGSWWILASLFIGSAIWIVTLCLLAMATSAWVKWRIVAGALIFGVVFVAGGFAQAINATLHTTLGHVVNLHEVIRTIWSWLFQGAAELKMPVAMAWVALAAFCGVCYLLLVKKLRAYHVERS